MRRLRLMYVALVLALVISPAGTFAKWRGFKAQELIGGKYSVSYTPKTISGKVPNIMLYVVGNTGALCLAEGYSHAKLDLATGEKYQGIKQVTGVVEFFKEEVDDADDCEEMARRPKSPKDLKDWKKRNSG